MGELADNFIVGGGHTESTEGDRCMWACPNDQAPEAL